MTQRDVVGREVGGEFMFGIACTPMVDSCQCMAKPTQYWKQNKVKIKFFLKKSINSSALSFLHSATLTSYMTTGKTIALTRWTFVGHVMSLLLNMLSRLVITFLPKSKHLLISWLQSPSEVILEPRKIKSDTVSTVSPSISHEVMGPDAMIFIFWMLSFKPTFSLSSSLSSRGFLAPLHFLP